MTQGSVLLYHGGGQDLEVFDSSKTDRDVSQQMASSDWRISRVNARLLLVDEKCKIFGSLDGQTDKEKER